MNDNIPPKKSPIAQAKEDIVSNFDKVLKLNGLQRMVLIILIIFVVVSVRDLTKPLHPSVVDKDAAVQTTAPVIPTP